MKLKAYDAVCDNTECGLQGRKQDVIVEIADGEDSPADMICKQCGGAVRKVLSGFAIGGRKSPQGPVSNSLPECSSGPAHLHIERPDGKAEIVIVPSEGKVIYRGEGPPPSKIDIEITGTTRTGKDLS